MIELDRHIEILLLSNDCVIVPDFGGFMAHHVDARYDEADGTFLPPLRTLGFNPQLKMNDSLLAQSYIEAYDISYPESIRRIEDEVAELKQHLETNGSFELNDLGTLRMNAEGKMEFEPCEAGILTPELYGLSSFEMKQLQTQQAVEEEEVATEIPMTNVEKDETLVKESDITIKMSWIRNIVAVAAAILAFFMIGTPISNSNIQQSSFIHIKASQPQPTATTHEAVPTQAENSETDENATETSEASEQVEPQKTYSYTLVLASQVSKKNANNFIATLQKAGFNDARILETTMTRVVYGTYATKNEVYNAQQQLRAKSRHFKEAWVMKIENQ